MEADSALGSIVFTCLGACLSLLALSPRPFRFLGVRVGYAYIDEYCWKFITALGGFIALATGCSMAIASALVSDEVAVMVASAGYIALFVIPIIVGEKVAEKRLMELPDTLSSSKPYRLALLRPSMISIVLPLIVSIATLIASLTLLALLAPRMPSEVAIHFDIFGNPDAYGPKSAGILSIAVSGATILVISLVVGLLAIKKIEVFYRPWLRPSSWASLAKLTVYALSIACILTSYAIADFAYFNAFGKHLIQPTWIGLAIFLPTLLALVLWLGIKELGSRYR